jgi:hypothetical protein
VARHRSLPGPRRAHLGLYSWGRSPASAAAGAGGDGCPWSAPCRHPGRSPSVRRPPPSPAALSGAACRAVTRSPRPCRRPPRGQPAAQSASPPAHCPRRWAAGGPAPLRGPGRPQRRRRSAPGDGPSVAELPARSRPPTSSRRSYLQRFAAEEAARSPEEGVRLAEEASPVGRRGGPRAPPPVGRTRHGVRRVASDGTSARPPPLRDARWGHLRTRASDVAARRSPRSASRSTAT